MVRPRSRGQLQAEDARVVEGVAAQHHLGAEVARVLDLHRRGEARHDDRRRDAHPLGVIGHGLGVVAGRDGEHAAGALGGGELGHLVERAPLLERGGELQVLELQEHLAAADRRQGARFEAGGLADLAAQPRSGAVDVGGQCRIRIGAHGVILAPARRRIHPDTAAAKTYRPTTVRRRSPRRCRLSPFGVFPPGHGVAIGGGAATVAPAATAVPVEARHAQEARPFPRRPGTGLLLRPGAGRQRFLHRLHPRLGDGHGDPDRPTTPP